MRGCGDVIVEKMRIFGRRKELRKGIQGKKDAGVSR
jgi:hypothetical protein